MKDLLLILFTFIMLLGFASCDSSQSAIRNLEVLLNEIEENHQSYTKEEWEKVSLSYFAIEEELAKYEYSEEELKEIGRLKGKCMAYLTKQSLKDMEKQMKNLTKELEGSVKGFLEVLSKDNNN